MNQKTLLSILIVIFAGNIFSYNTYGQRSPAVTLHDTDGSNYIYAIAFNHDYSKIITGSKNAVIWDMKTGEQIMTLETLDNVSGVGFSPDGKYIATCERYARAVLWNANTGQRIQVFEGKHRNISEPPIMLGFVFTKDGSKLYGGVQGGPLMEWNVITGETREIGGYAANNMTLSPDEKRLFQTGTDRKGGITSLIDGEHIHSFPGRGASISPDFKYVYNFDSSNDPTYHVYMQVWDANTGELLRTTDLVNYSGKLNSLASPTGNLVISEEAIPLRLFGVNEKSVVATLANSFEKQYDKILFTPDGKKVVATIGTTVHIWDVSDLTSHVKQAGKY